MLTDNDIKDLVYISSAYSNGIQYFRQGRVKNLEYDSENREFQATVKGGTFYFSEIIFNEEEEVEEYRCDCPAFYQYDGACKHIIATLKEIQANWDTFFGEKKSKSLILNKSTKALLDFFNNVNEGASVANKASEGQKIKILPIFCFSVATGYKQNWLEFSIGISRYYIMKDVKKFAESLIYSNQISYGKNFVFDPDRAIFDDRSQKIAELIKATHIDEENISAGSYYPYNSNSIFLRDRTLKMSNANLLKFFEIMSDEAFDISINGKRIPNVKIIKERPKFKLDVMAGDNGLRAELDLEDDVYYGLDSGFNYFYHKNSIYKVDELFAKYAAPLMNCFNENSIPQIFIPQTETHSFISSVVPQIEKIADVKLDVSLTNNFYRENLEKHVYLDKYGDGIAAKVTFKYGDILVNPLNDIETEEKTKDGKSLLREIPDENKVLNILMKYNFETVEDRYVQKDEAMAYDFLKEGLEEIRGVSEVFYSDGFKNINIKNSSRISAGIRINSGTGFLEMSMQYEDIEPKELMDLLASYKLKKRYHRLKTGHFIPIDTSELRPVVELIEQLNLSQADISKKVIELPKYRAMYIDSLAREREGLHIERSSNFKKMVQDVTEPEDMEFDLPEGINGKLRDYQKTGYKWLKTLSYYGFGGILADDMGLGKTLQIITFVKSENSEEKKPSIVIAPTSLVYNWQEEVKKFAPDLIITVLAGTQTGRREKFGEIETSDIVVTSYGMVKKDIELYKNYKFKYCFIDEAQHIKNPNTLNAKAVKQIKATNYFALTGTPVENTLTELWSIFDFIMPNYLLSHNKFASRFETPIVKNSDESALKELGRHIKPFVLRRMKKEVLKELPEKIESKMTNEMSEEQKKLYVAYMMQAKQEFEEEVSTHGFGNSRIKIIAILTRLRQICCHPALFIENYKGGSGKLDMLIELLEDAVSGGHRVLIFSQFTSMLALIKDKLDSIKMTYHYLDGSTSAQERIRLVNLFNAGEKDIFLISLKAGGTGLNLTGADMVVHFDPWWNPAVEDQATDRAYRIGQKNAVQVFKLITKDTIEEKIFELQQKKKELIDAVIKPGENFLTKMTEEEIKKLFDIS